MRKKFFYFVAGLGLVSTPLWAQTAATVATVPEGFFSYSFPATTMGNQAVYLSLPLSSSPTYTGAVSSLTDTTITVADSPAPWTANALTGATPYYVKFLTGSEAGRVIKVSGNTTNTLTLDTTDASIQTVVLSTSGFAVSAGDTFEVFAGDTLASVFGSNSTQSPLVLRPGANALVADTIGLFNPLLMRWQAYYFNSTANCWEMSGSTANANNVVLPPHCAMTVLRRSNETASSLVLTGRVAEVAPAIKVVGNSNFSYGSTSYACDITLSQLQFGSNWTQSTSALTADTIGVWDTTLARMDTYYQLPDSTWRKAGDTVTDVSSTVLPAGGMVGILKRGSVSGATSFLQSSLPYSID